MVWFGQILLLLYFSHPIHMILGLKSMIVSEEEEGQVKQFCLELDNDILTLLSLQKYFLLNWVDMRQKLRLDRLLVGEM